MKKLIIAGSVLLTIAYWAHFNSISHSIGTKKIKGQKYSKGIYCRQPGFPHSAQVYTFNEYKHMLESGYEQKYEKDLITQREVCKWVEKEDGRG